VTGGRAGPSGRGSGKAQRRSAEVDDRSAQRRVEDIVVGPTRRSRAVGGSAGTISYRRLNPFTGTPAVLHVEDHTPAGPPQAEALALLEAAAPELGLGEAGSGGVAGSFVADPVVTRTSTGAQVVHLYQHHQGIPLLDMVRTVVLGPDGRVRRIAGENHPRPTGVDLVPRISAADAGRRAAEHLGLTWGPRVEASFNLPAQPTVLDRGPFESQVPAHLVLFGRGEGETGLGWHLVLDLPDDVSYTVVVAAAGGGAGAVRLCRRTSVDVGPVYARVFPEDPDGGDREVTLPPAAGSYLLPMPDGFPRDWCRGPDTDGAFARVTDAAGALVKATAEGDIVRFPLPEGDVHCLERCIVNAFYLCSLAHDLFLLLGFDELSMNFESVGSGSGGLDGDPVVVRVTDEHGGSEAHFTTRPDGRPPVMVLGRHRVSGRPTALDFDVVLHEYAHGVTTRLVGGHGNPASLSAPQSHGLGEGWSDYFALTLRNHVHGRDRTTVGTWSANDPKGLRRHAYDRSFPASFGDVGTEGYTEAHDIGSIWAATLIEMQRALVDACGPSGRGSGEAGGDDGRTSGNVLGWRLVMDALRITPGSPSLLDARDAMLVAAADIDEHRRQAGSSAGNVGLPGEASVDSVVRPVFARFGMGRTAATEGPYLQGIVASHDQ
jgi:extracellular elastinolytic metalloproteinase